MAWQVVAWTGHLGRSRDRRQREFDSRFGPNNWRTAHMLQQRVLELAEVGRLVELSYLELFRKQPDWLNGICEEVKDVYENARSNIRSSFDYSVQERKCIHIFDIAIRRAVRQLGRDFTGERLIRIGGPSSSKSPLSPGRVPFIHHADIAEPRAQGWWDADSVLSFWESNRVVLVHEA